MISTHTPARGVTLIVRLEADLLINFNSHAGEGRDFGIDVEKLEQGISTHTPARGVTFLASSSDGILSTFQLTRPRGA